MIKYKIPYNKFQKYKQTPAQRLKKSIAYFKRRVRRLFKKARWLKRKKLTRKKKNRKFYRRSRRVSLYYSKLKQKSVVSKKSIKNLNFKGQKHSHKLLQVFNVREFDFSLCVNSLNPKKSNYKFNYFKA